MNKYQAMCTNHEANQCALHCVVNGITMPWDFHENGKRPLFPIYIYFLFLEIIFLPVKTILQNVDLFNLIYLFILEGGATRPDKANFPPFWAKSCWHWNMKCVIIQMKLGKFRFSSRKWFCRFRIHYPLLDENDIELCFANEQYGEI